ncbi:hypothetical protein pb186bvf_002587 [Paramecium bursaria]
MQVLGKDIGEKLKQKISLLQGQYIEFLNKQKKEKKKYFLFIYIFSIIIIFLYIQWYSDEDEQAKQAKRMEEMMANGGLKKKGPLVNKQKPQTQFDSATFQMQQYAQQQGKK